MGKRREYQVIIERTVELDEDRVEEWVEHNHLPGDRVQVQDMESGDLAYSDI